jgi:hypothetical protein
MTNANKLYGLDAAKRKKCGWGAMAFISPEIPSPKTPTERAIRKAFGERLKQAYQLHVYDVVEMLEQAYDLGVKHESERIFKRARGS